MPGHYFHMRVAQKTFEGLATRVNADPGLKGLFSDPSQNPVDLQRIAQAHSPYVALGAIGPDMFLFLPDFKPPYGQIWEMAGRIRQLYQDWDQQVIGPYEDAMLSVSYNATDLLAELTDNIIPLLASIFSRAIDILKQAITDLIVTQYDLFAVMGSSVPAGVDEQSFTWFDILHYRNTYRLATVMWQKAEDWHIKDQTKDPEWMQAASSMLSSASSAVNIDVDLADGSTDIDSTPGEVECWRERLKAYTLGWITHLATDVTGHPFVNAKVGGPYRLHWQRHHLVENHIDARVYQAHLGELKRTDGCYSEIGCAALHKWVSFVKRADDPTDDAQRPVNIFDEPGFENYLGGKNASGLDDAAARFARHESWDVDSVMRYQLARFISESLHEAFAEDENAAADNGPMACCPTIISSLNVQVPGAGPHAGDPTPADVSNAYWYLTKFLKDTTTDFYKTRRPPDTTGQWSNLSLAPKNDPADPKKDPTGNSANGAGVPTPDLTLESPLDMLRDAASWCLKALASTEEAAARLAADVEDDVKGFADEVIRKLAELGADAAAEVLYETFELPLYNLWQMLHAHLALTGYAMPMKEEINDGLTTLGRGVDAGWNDVLADLTDLDGGLLRVLSANSSMSAPSAPDLSGSDASYPRNAVTDLLRHLPLGSIIGGPAGVETPSQTFPSEFTRPWRYPDTNIAGVAVPSEPSTSVGGNLVPPLAGPYAPGMPPEKLFDENPDTKGSATARQSIEGAESEIEMRTRVQALLANRQHLGFPVDYATYVVGKLTQPGLKPNQVADFNLDADRGYGYKAWDWLRSGRGEVPDVKAAPAAFQNSKNKNVYAAPLAAGYGWDPSDLSNVSPRSTTPPPPPADPTLATDRPVRIRFINVENKLG